VQVNITCTLHPGIEMGLHPEVLPRSCHPLQSGETVGLWNRYFDSWRTPYLQIGQVAEPNV
jgi:hypothetical protein